jgi:hypothetical protein
MKYSMDFIWKAFVADHKNDSSNLHGQQIFKKQGYSSLYAVLLIILVTQYIAKTAEPVLTPPITITGSNN